MNVKEIKVIVARKAKSTKRKDGQRAGCRACLADSSSRIAFHHVPTSGSKNGVTQANIHSATRALYFMYVEREFDDPRRI